jgi:hypothetical protein
MSIFFSFILLGSGNELSGISRILFTEPIAQLLWIFVPIVLLGVFKNKRST